MATLNDLANKLDELLNAHQEESQAAERYAIALRQMLTLIQDLSPRHRDRILSVLETTKPEERRTNFDRIAEFIRSQGNQPQTLRSIAKGTEMTNGSITQVLYRTHKDRFICASAPGFQRRKMWSLRGEPTERNGDGTLFDGMSLEGLAAHECCEQILRDHGNSPMNALTLAREALARGYAGKATGDADDILMTTAKSFWARMGRDRRFFRIRSEKFRLRELSDPEPIEDIRDDLTEGDD